MEYKLLGAKNDIAQLLADEVLIYDAQSALDVLATAQYETGCDKFILGKACFTEDFFVLSTGIAGAALQKFVNYRKKVAIIGDYAGYTSKPYRILSTKATRATVFTFCRTSARPCAS